MQIPRLCAALVVVTLAVPLYAETPPPFVDFSAKFVKPPKAGTKRRITVQIAPQPARPKPVAVAAAAAAVAPLAPAGRSTGTGRYGWFWDSVSPALAASGPGRLEPALIRLGNPPAGAGVAAPRLQDLANIARAHGRDILLSTVGTKVSPALVLAVMAVESGGRVDAVSSAGAQGLMQLMPATASRFGVSDSLNATQNIKGGVAFLELLMNKFDGDPILVLAGYNAGENSIGQNNGVPPYAETRDYVPKVLSAFQAAKGLCQTQPQLISDGCVFVASR
ncbi:lytic transglycosylase domain-containing protein [Puniceibacterium confluentis]|uniref:lytic transglycosylase domain-containing protein n=1 Tax=Puniceibacterium confluentis TaxID=1958944 RepID=UPI0011B7B175|nr:lytic transglycosylase domain-containing protein [Puniceibacterium confluentis]